MRAKCYQVLAWLVRLVRALRELPRAALRWLRSHAARCVASVWLTGMGVLGVAMVRRVVAAQVADPPTLVHPRADGAVEQVVMLDVDEINDIRNRRLHALGLAAAGDTGAPDDKTVQAARVGQARGIELDGEPVATAGKLVVVTRGGIAGWLKRNRGKKADPETLAWLRGEEAAEGRASYAGWADREDGNILSWARDQRHAGAAQPTHAEPSAGAAAAGAREPDAAGATSAAGAPADGPGGVPRDRRAQGTVDARAGGAAAVQATAVPDARAAAPGMAVQGLGLVALGGAAARALLPQTPVDPSASELAALRERFQPLSSTGAIAISVRDHRVVLMLLCDRLFDRARPELTEQGAHVVRELGRLLADDRGHAYNVTVDRERAFELVSNLAIAGLAPERIEIALKQVDSAIDVIEIEWIVVKDTP